MSFGKKPFGPMQGLVRHRGFSVAWALLALVGLFFSAGCSSQGSQNSGGPEPNYGPFGPEGFGSGSQEAVGGALASGGFGISGAGGSGVLQQVVSADDPALVSDSVRFLSAKYNRQDVPQAAVIKDAESLKAKQAAIYGNAENGFVLVVWPDLLVVYDPVAKEVVQELPVGSMGV